MQQPPSPGRQPLPPPQARPQHYAPPGVPPPSSAASQFPPPVGPSGTPRKSRGALKFLASTCIISAWITLVLSLLGGGLALLSAIGMQATLSKASNAQQYFPTRAPSDPTGGLLGDGGLNEALGGGGGVDGAPSGPLTGLSDIARQAIPGMTMAGAVFTLASGAVTFLLFLGLGQLCYILIDLEQQQSRMEDMLQIVVGRLGAGR